MLRSLRRVWLEQFMSPQLPQVKRHADGQGEQYAGREHELARDHGAPPPFIRSDGIAGEILLATAAAIIC